MLQKFNENNNITKFIKNLLHTTYVPTVKIWKPGIHIVKDFSYISKDYILIAKKSWPDVVGSTVEGPQSPLDDEYFEVIEPYVEGEFYENVTSNYNSNTFNYDSNTHYYLGQYLRMIRDLHDIDLMQYYNCWNDVYSDKIRIKPNYVNTKLDSVTIIANNTKIDGYKTLLVPIKYNQKYTIYANSNMPIEICPIYYDGINVLMDRTEFIANKDNYKKIIGISYNQPSLYGGVFTYTKNNNTKNTLSINSIEDSNLVYSEKYLTLVVQIPESNSSSVVILEGDYTNSILLNTNESKNKLFPTVFGKYNPENGTELDLDSIPEEDFERYFKSYPYILHNVNNENYAFSDRLIEYLLLNVITKDDSNSYNINRIQTYNSSFKSLKLNKDRLDLSGVTQGIWDRKLRKYNYDLVTNFDIPLSFDVNGYVDKDTEKIIMRGKE